VHAIHGALVLENSGRVVSMENPYIIQNSTMLVFKPVVFGLASFSETCAGFVSKNGTYPLNPMAYDNFPRLKRISGQIRNKH